MQVLAIGNSFTQDSTAYLKRIAECACEPMTAVNLYIGGCTLEKHYRNMLAENKAYSLEFNGETTGFFVSMNEALLSRDWDAIVIHQASRAATDYGTFQPYLSELADFVRTCCPKAKLYMHQTWASDIISGRPLSDYGFATRTDMYKALVPVCENAAKSIEADGIIRSGEMMLRLAENGFTRLYRDNFHASYDIGRYALALTWFKALTGKSVLDNNFKCRVGNVTDDEYNVIKNCAEEIKCKF
jgi:hypothetical protein